MGQKGYSDATFKLMVEASPIALILVNQHGNIAFVNAFTENLFQYSKRELMGSRLETLIPKRFRHGHKNHLQSFLEKPETRQMGKGRDLFAVKKDGTEFPVEIGLNPIIQGDELLILAVIIDISKRKHSEMLLEKHSRQLEIKNNELEQFSALASHDLQEPLNTIISWTELIKYSLELSAEDESNQMFGYITSAAKRMKWLIQGLLEYSRLGKDAKIQQVDCNKLLDSIREDITALIEESGAIFEISGMPTIWAYELELRLLFQNLIINAIKYRKEGVRPKVVINAEWNDNAWQFTVKDNGIGIAPRHHDQIFNIFQRIEEDGSVRGSGIGLAHCRKIIDLHHGTIKVDSKLGEGSTFIFTIPDLKRH